MKAAWIALVERANLEAAAAIHTTSSIEAGPSFWLRLEAAADRHYSARRR